MSSIGVNFFATDVPLQRQLRRHIHPSLWGWSETRLHDWGALTGGPIARRAEIIDKNPPRLEAYDNWGRYVGRVVHHPEAIATKRDLCEAGHTGFSWSSEVRNDPARSKVAPLLSTTFSYMLNQSDTGMACACGMTGGVAAIVDRFAAPEVREEFLPHLTTTTFDDLWDGSMFMTERSGGSDLSGTETIAKKDGDAWILEGEKWFCSNVDGRAILTLARPEGAAAGTRGLGLFLVPRSDGVRIRRIKDKLGTRSVPTGEVIFERALAHQIGDAGIGLNRMMEMVNISRIGVAVMGAGIARRCVHEASMYAGERMAFGRRLVDFPMVRETLIDMQVEAEAAMLLCLEVPASVDRDPRYRRILTPLVKIRATRTGLENAVQAVEVLGGNGYIEDWPTARQLRDAQCHTIWEGTENINSLDVLRAMAKQGAHEALLERLDGIVQNSGRGSEAETLSGALDEVKEGIAAVAEAPEVHAKRFANLLCDVLGAGLLIEAAETDRDRLVARRYVDRHLRTLPRFKDGWTEIDAAFGMIVPPFTE